MFILEIGWERFALETKEQALDLMDALKDLKRVEIIYIGGAPLYYEKPQQLNITYLDKRVTDILPNKTEAEALQKRVAEQQLCINPEDINAPL